MLSKFVKYVIFSWFCLTSLTAFGQEKDSISESERMRMEIRDSLRRQKDSIQRMNYYDKLYCDSLADSVFRAIVFDDVDSVMHYFAPLDSFRKDADSAEFELLRVKYETIYWRLIKDHKKMRKRAKKDLKIRIKSLKHKKTRTDIRITEDGHRFCIVTIECGYNRKKAEVSFHLIKVASRWYLGEKLRIRPAPEEN